LEKDIKEFYGIKKNNVGITRHPLDSGKVLDVFPNPGEVKVQLECPEFTCKCPRTGQPDFAFFTIAYRPDQRCVETESLKYYVNSFRDENHFHEEVTWLIARDLVDALQPLELELEGEFNVRGGIYPTIKVSYTKEGGWS